MLNIQDVDGLKLPMVNQQNVFLDVIAVDNTVNKMTGTLKN
jgi:hypothetical protein